MYELISQIFILMQNSYFRVKTGKTNLHGVFHYFKHYCAGKAIFHAGVWFCFALFCLSE